MKIKQVMVQAGGLGGQTRTWTRVIEVTDETQAVGTVVDDKTKVHDWTETKTMENE